jgi:hypothetical protein
MIGPARDRKFFIRKARIIDRRSAPVDKENLEARKLIERANGLLI